MYVQRRDVLKAGGGLAIHAALLAIGLIRSDGAVAARNRAAFDARTLAEVLAALGADQPEESSAVRLKVPDIAENGATVPMSVVSDLPRTEQISLLVERNPNMLAAIFEIPEGTLADVGTSLKMRQTSEVYAFVRADGRFYMARKEVKVTIGGCGG